jgi:hypothetical protein
MSEVDRAKVRRTVVAAIRSVAGGHPIEDSAAVEEYLKTSIRKVLGGSVPQSEREVVAKQIRLETIERMRQEFGLAPNAVTAQYQWLTQHESELASTYADKVEEALEAIRGQERARQ